MRELEAEALAGLRIEAAIRTAISALRSVGIEGAATDVRFLTAAALGCSKLDLIRHPERVVTLGEARRLAGFVARRCEREPVSRILGLREFYGRSFMIEPATLDPRPDTETLIDLVLELAGEEGWRTCPIRILDVGTGSGCIALTLLAELPHASAVGTDIDPDALRVAAANAANLGMTDRVEFKLCRSFSGVGPDFDLVVSNPPYIPARQIAGLEPEVKNFDPRSALDGGEDGLDVVRELAGDLDRVLAKGWFVLEVGAGQAPAALEILDPLRSRKRRITRDLGGHDRCVAVWTHR